MLTQAIGTPAEDFADAYANCRLRRDPRGLWDIGYTYMPTWREHRRVCKFITRAMLDPGSPVDPLIGL